MNSPIEEIKHEKKQLLTRFLESQGKEKLIASNQDAILTVDLDGYVIQVNPSFEELMGFSNREAKQLKFQSMIATEELDKFLNYFHKAALGQFHNFDCKSINKWGQIIDLNIMLLPISSENQIAGIQIIAKDITQLKRKKAEVRRIEEFHRLLTDHILDIILTTNVLGEILYVSPSCEAILGYTPDELAGWHFSELVDKKDREKAVLNHGFTELESSRVSFRLRKKDGNFVWVESLSKPIVDPDTRNIIEIVGVMRDITERVKATEELLNRKKAFRNLVEHSPDAVVIASNERITFINETGIKLLNAESVEEVMSKTLLDFVHPDYQQIARERIKSVTDGEPTTFKQFVINRMDGTPLEVEIKAVPTFFNHQSGQHIIIRDMTERKKTQELLLHSEKLTIAGQLAAGIAHEVRNPLTAIKGFLQLMEAQLENKAYIDIIQSEMDRIELILGELLVLAKPQDLKYEKEQMKTLMNEVKMLIDTQAIMKDVQIEIVNQCEDLTINCDKNQLKQVFINFLKNSLEAMPNGGMITIELKRLGNDRVKIFFKDTGSGIPPHLLKRIGEPFFTTKEGGTGLGVMISKQIIENHHGSVNFWSDENGTLIEVILPL
ncbi:PAS domain S-box protein [Neobacillus muris]|uniref:PAS domain S-box protein n=1 Tax=Neobacillus muris TaxID=2941334 RepID=UPI0020423F37|nr:PAS domain S-box protein [Neobacillus muris]